MILKMNEERTVFNSLSVICSAEQFDVFAYFTEGEF